MKKIEVLAPAGTFETMQAAVRAGADAVYLGGGRFGARAYAGNLDEDHLLRAIDYVHLHGRKLYLTVNTLLKQEELEESLYAYIKPYYEHGLDAAIVQDLGVLSFLRREFPGLPIHASTQMTVAGPDGAKLLQECGAARVVIPRELSLDEIRRIRGACDLEIEGFVHGALCYCYSGQCLMSSMIGGRSGNRGRCAQPCRMAYRASDGRNLLNRPEEAYLLSPKDMNTLAILPDIIEAGVTSLKIEGRMKKPVYTAGVTEVYRKYVDAYLEYGREGYHAAEEDQKQLFDLFNRNGFHESYYKQHNGKHMMALTEKEFRFGNEPLAARLQAVYLDREKKEMVQMQAYVAADQPICLTLTHESPRTGRVYGTTVTGPVPQPAQKQPATEESICKQLSKLGNTDFAAEEITAFVEDGLFVPVVQLNELRRQGIAALTEEIVGEYRRELSGNAETALPEAAGAACLKVQSPETMCFSGKNSSADSDIWSKPVYALAATLDQAKVLYQSGRIKRLYIESEAGSEKELESLARHCRESGIACYLAMPYVFRDKARDIFADWGVNRLKSTFDGFLARSVDELFWLAENGFEQDRVVADCGLYSWNQEARSFLRAHGAGEDTVPLELNWREMADRGAEGSELIIYGRVPMMISAQCVRKNTTGCKPNGMPLILTDRMKENFPVRFVCRYCYNVIYNSRPLSGFTLHKELQRVNPAAFRLSFSTEQAKEVADVLQKCLWEDPEVFTRGHWKRGVE